MKNSTSLFGLLGSQIAVVISWSLHTSVLWAIFHGIFSWFYVIYYVCTR